MSSAVRLACLALSLLWAVGCSGFADPDAVSDHVGLVTGVQYARTGGLTVGSSALRLARIGVAAAGEESPDLLQSLKDVQIGVYRAVDPNVDSRGVRAGDFARYEPLVSLQIASGEEILLLSRSSARRTRELLAVIEGEQLVVIQVRGDLENILEDVVRLAFSRADRSDLAPAVLDSLSERSSR